MGCCFEVYRLGFHGPNVRAMAAEIAEQQVRMDAATQLRLVEARLLDVAGSPL